MTRRLVAIGLIFAAVSAAWMILSGSIFFRTHDADSGLKAGVQSLWGSEQRQVAPTASYSETHSALTETEENGKQIFKAVAAKDLRPIPLAGSRIRADLDLSHRQKGLLWYATYKVKFAGHYRFTNDTGVARDVSIRFPFPDPRAVYDNFVFKVNGRPWKATPNSANGHVLGVVSMAPGETIEVDTGYSSQGLDNWRYGFGEGVAEIKNFQLAMHTNFRDIDYPADGLVGASPSASRKATRVGTCCGNTPIWFPARRSAWSCRRNSSPGHWRARSPPSRPCRCCSSSW